MTDAQPPAMLLARLAGLCYLAVIAGGLFAEVGVHSSLIVPDSVSATAARIVNFPARFRAGFAADSFMVLSDVAIAVLLYRLFQPLRATLALLAAAFRLAQAASLGLNLLNYAQLLCSAASLNGDWRCGCFSH